MEAHRVKIVIPEDHRVLEVTVVQGAKERFEKLADELAADPRPFRDLSPEEREERLRRVMGIGRGLFSSSEEFARRKQEEIEIEDRHLGR